MNNRSPCAGVSHHHCSPAERVSRDLSTHIVSLYEGTGYSFYSKVNGVLMGLARSEISLLVSPAGGQEWRGPCSVDLQLPRAAPTITDSQ